MNSSRRLVAAACTAALLACVAPAAAPADVLELPDRSIVTTQPVSAGEGSDTPTVLAKFTPEGELDTSFAGDRVVRGVPGEVLARGADGRIVLAGLEHTTEGGGSEDDPPRELFSLVLERFHADGTRDVSFGDGGRVVTRFKKNVRPFGLIVGEDGSLLVGGVAFLDIGYQVSAFVARYAADGTLDDTFGEGGIALSPPFEGEEAVNVYDGSLVASGGRLVVTAARYAVRFGPDGSVDTSVGGDGVLRLAPNDPEPAEPFPDLLTPVEGGYVWLEPEPDSTAFGPLRRGDVAGTRDDEWGDGGAARVDVAPEVAEWTTALAEDAAGRVLAAGRVGDDVGLARLTPAGEPDEQFGGDGGVLLGLDPGRWSVDDVIEAPGGGVLAGGALTDAAATRRDLWVARYTEAGEPDPAFGTDGVVVTRFDDTTPPEVRIDSGPPAGVLGDRGEFTFSSPEAGVAFECRLDAEPWAACASPVSYDGVAEGNHVFSVRATDAAGNPRETGRAWIVNHAAPDGTLIAAPPARSSSSRARFEFSSSDPDSTFRCRLDTGKGQPCESPFEFGGLSDGEHEFEIRAIDAFGVADAEPILYRWTVDTRVPDPGPTDPGARSGPPQLVPPVTIVPPPPPVLVRPTVKLEKPALYPRAIRLRVRSDVAARIRVTGRLGRRGQRRGGIRLVTARRTAAAGRAITVRVKLGRQARTRLDRARRPLVVRLTVTATAEGGGKRVRRVRLKIRPPAPPDG